VSGYQFNHAGAYSRRGAHKKNSSVRKASMDGILNEMIRAPGACSHVSVPEPPNVVFGVHPVTAFSLAAERARRAVDKAGRKLSVTALVVLVGVATWPVLTSEVRADPQAMEHYLYWREMTIQWLARQWGDQLKTVVEHLDEDRPHLHYVVVPDLDPDRRLRIESVHAGYRAANKCKAEGGSPRDQKAAYKAKMRCFQDDYYEHVGVHCGLTRLGPRLQRVSREEWKQQQRQAEAIARAHRGLEERASELKARAKAYVSEKTMEANATAQLKIDAITSRADQHAKEIRQKAKSFIIKQDERIWELKQQVLTSQAAFVAQQEELDIYRRLLEENGLLPSLEASSSDS
jgi:hypothetical protein